MTRYTWRDWDTYGEVVEHATGRVVSTHDLVSDAVAEAARLNAGGTARAKDVVAWAIKDWRGRLHAPTVHYTRAEAIASYTSQKGWRIAKRAGNTCVRVRITEIPEQEASDGE